MKSKNFIPISTSKFLILYRYIFGYEGGLVRYLRDIYNKKEFKGIKNKKILAISYGGIQFTSFLSTNDNEVIIADLSGAAPTLFLNKNNFIRASSKFLPFKNEYFDIVVCLEVFERIDSNQRLINEITRVLKYSKKISGTIGIRLLDFCNIPISDLNKLPYTMFNYDLKYGGVTIFGNPLILDEIPEMDPSKMPLTEGKQLLFNRLICQIECFDYVFLERSPKIDEKFFLVNQCYEVILACSSALLLIKGNYHYSYHERNIRFHDLYANQKKLLELNFNATEFKLKPTTRIDFDVIDFWFEVKNLYLEVILYFINHFYKVNDRKFLNLPDFNDFYMNESNYSDKSKLESAVIFLLLSINKTGINPGLLKKARDLLVSLIKEEIPGDDWESVRKLCVKVWFEIIMSKKS